MQTKIENKLENPLDGYQTKEIKAAMTMAEVTATEISAELWKRGVPYSSITIHKIINKDRESRTFIVEKVIYELLNTKTQQYLDHQRKLRLN